MANFPGQIEKGVTDDATNRVYVSSLSSSLGTPPRWTEVTPFDDVSAVLTGTKSLGTIVAPSTDYDGVVESGGGTDWFEKIIILERRYDLGIVITLVQRDIEVYNSYREDAQTLQAFTNNAGEGITIPDLPALPTTILPQSSITGTLTITTSGPAVIDGELVFTFLVLGDFTVPITGQRAIIIPFVPEVPLVERMAFKTDILERLPGTEQRIALRDTPRQHFDAIYRLDGHDRRAFLAILFDAQGRAAGFPMWQEPTRTTAPIAVSDTTISVESTSYADWRADSVGIVLTDSETYEALEVESFTETTITFSSPFQTAFATGSIVMPVRTSYFRQDITGGRAPLALQTFAVRYDVLENSADLADASAFETYRSKVLLDEPNWIDRELEDTVQRRMTTIDNGVGTFLRLSEWGASRRIHRKTFFCRTRQRVWEVRQLLHALRGRAISFYIPTFYPDVEPLSDLVSGTSTLSIKNIGYTDLIQDRSPKGDLQVVMADGTKIRRQITGSSEVDDTEETLTVDSNWGVDGPIERVEFLEKVRLDSDEILIEHLDSQGSARISAPVKAVLE